MSGVERAFAKASSREESDEKEFASLSSANLEIIRHVARPYVFPPDVQIFSQGGHAEDVYFIEEGLVKLAHVNENGKDFILGLRAEGWPLGAASVISRSDRQFSAIAVILTPVWHIAGREFLDLVGKNPALSLFIHEAHSREILEQASRLIGFGSSTARERLESLLDQMVSAIQPRNAPPKVRFQLPLKQREIAQLIGVTDQHLSRLWSQLENEGVIRREKGWVVMARHR